MADMQDSSTRIAAAIADYLARHPEAADSLEGIQRWWLSEGLSGVTAHSVQAALDGLVAAGCMRRVPVSGGAALYANPIPDRADSLPSRADPGGCDGSATRQRSSRRS